MLRAFVAIRPPDETCELLEEMAADLPASRPVAFENLHMTLEFLGQHPAPEIEEVAHALAQIRAESFALKISGVGVFGGDRPRSVHVGFAPEPKLMALQSRIARAAEAAGMGDRRRFTPHLTLARFNGNEGETEAFRGWMRDNAGFTLAAFEVEAFLLYRSETTRSGPIYTELARFPLESA